MIIAVFGTDGKNIRSLTISGHSGSAESGKDIVCAAVSSAVMLTANLLTDHLISVTSVDVGENEIRISVNDQNPVSYNVLTALYEHLRVLSAEYPGTIGITLRKRHSG